MNNIKGILIVMIVSVIALAVLYSPWLSPGLYNPNNGQGFNRSVNFGGKIENSTLSYSNSTRNDVLPSITAPIVNTGKLKSNSKRRVSIEQKSSVNSSPGFYSAVNTSRDVALSTSSPGVISTPINVRGGGNRNSVRESSEGFNISFTSNLSFLAKDKNPSRLNSNVLENGLLSESSSGIDGQGPLRGPSPGDDPVDPPISAGGGMEIALLFALAYVAVLNSRKTKLA